MIQEAITIDIDSIGIINGCVDPVIQLPYGPEMALNNDYNIPATTEAEYREALSHLNGPGGCNDQIADCRLATRVSPMHGNTTVDEICHAANVFCGKNVANAASDGSVSILDIAQPPEYPLVPSYFIGFLNQPHVQAALGVPLNFTPTSRAVVKAFSMSGDNVRYQALTDLGVALDSGIKIALIYGDRDLACNCEKSIRCLF